MTNSQANLSNGVGFSPANDKQQPYAMKKTSLSDAQNPNGIFLASHQGPVKISRTKKLTPENPSKFHSQLSFGNNAANEHIVNARRRFELELGNGRSYSVEKYADWLQPMQACRLQQENPNKQIQLKGTSSVPVPVTTPTPPAKFFYGGPSVRNHVKGSPGISQNTCSKTTIERKMTDRFIQLQQFLKQCDESRHKHYPEMLSNLSPSELSRHAVELEKKTIHLAIEEAKELERMKSLNILTQSTFEYPIQPTPSSRK